MIIIKYQLYKKNNPDFSPIVQLLYNRDIPEKDIDKWLNADMSFINSWKQLDENKMKKAVDLLSNQVNDDKPILFIVDADCDGFTSSAILINYLYKLYPEYTKKRVFWIQHLGKQHGFNDIIERYSPQELIKKYGENLLIIALDGGSNDRAAHKQLSDNNIKVLVLDHHEVDCDSEDALVINVQLCDYPNKALTGAGVGWQFCRAYDDIKNEDFSVSDSLIDLCALGNIGDMASQKEFEIRAIVNEGLKEIRNPFFYSMAKKNDYSISKMNGINYYSVAFYVVPFINAVVRSGTDQEKEIVFKSMLQMCAFDMVNSSKRGQKSQKTLLYEEAITVAERVKRRQTKAQDEGLKILESKIKKDNLLDNAMLILTCGEGEIAKSILGLVANKFQAKYQRPTLVLEKHEEDGKIIFRGSGRNYSKCPLQNMREICLQTEDVIMAQGHQSSFGIAIEQDKINSFIDKTNKYYEEIDMSPTYWVDYIWKEKELNEDTILDIAAANFYGQDVPESLIAVVDIPLNENNVTLMGVQKGHPTIKVQLGNVSLIKFKSSEEEYEKFIQPNSYLTAICKCSKNEWMGKVSAQLLVEDYELENKWIF